MFFHKKTHPKRTKNSVFLDASASGKTQYEYCGLLQYAWESGGKLIENLNDFEDLYRKGTKKYLGKDIFKVIGSAKQSKMITEEEGNELLFLLHHYRDPFSHASNNSEINKIKILSFDVSMNCRKITVNGNPTLYFDNQGRYMRNMAHQYFFKLYSYIKKWDVMIGELREKAKG